jgi:nucleoside-diphosphate-sugar epimerase
MSIRVVTVFGGTGFLGRRVVRHLREHGFPFGSPRTQPRSTNNDTQEFFRDMLRIIMSSDMRRRRESADGHAAHRARPADMA